MPNWVTNKLTVAGEREELDDFIDQNRSNNPEGWPLDFGQAVPMPAEIRNEKAAPNMFPAWYGWCIENWGTKWNADSVTVEGDPADGSVTYTFLTAWSPPDAWLVAASCSFCNLRFHHEFVEEMLHFAGRADWLAGVIVHHEAVEPEALEWLEIEELEWLEDAEE